MLTAPQVKKGTAQTFRLSNSARTFINFSWYDILDMLDLGHNMDKVREVHILTTGRFLIVIAAVRKILPSNATAGSRATIKDTGYETVSKTAKKSFKVGAQKN